MEEEGKDHGKEGGKEKFTCKIKGMIEGKGYEEKERKSLLEGKKRKVEGMKYIK